jgi:transcriptional regulator with XRE-family HTH domain
MLINNTLHSVSFRFQRQPYLSVLRTTDMAGKKLRRPLANRLGAKIAALRKARNWTQSELAERVEVDSETISRFERGATLPSLITLDRISQRLRVGVGELLAETSLRPDDQASTLSAWLTDLDESDRAFVVEMVKRACDHFRRS